MCNTQRHHGKLETEGHRFDVLLFLIHHFMDLLHRHFNWLSQVPSLGFLHLIMLIDRLPRFNYTKVQPHLIYRLTKFQCNLLLVVLPVRAYLLYFQLLTFLECSAIPQGPSSQSQQQYNFPSAIGPSISNNHANFNDHAINNQNIVFHHNTRDMIQNNLPIVDPFATTTFRFNPHASADNNSQNMIADNNSNASDEDHGNNSVDGQGDDDEHSNGPDGDGLLKGDNSRHLSSCQTYNTETLSTDIDEASPSEDEAVAEAALHVPCYGSPRYEGKW